MKIKKSICLLLSIMLAWSVLPVCQAESPISAANVKDSWKQELLLADYMGLPMDNLEKETITGAEMSELLDALVAFEAPDRLAEWQSLYPVFRQHKDPLPRIDVQSALFLAVQFIGMPFTDYVLSTNTINRELVDVSFGETDCPTWDLYGEVGSFDFGIFGIDHFGVGGTFYNNLTISPVSGEQPLAYDAANNAYHMQESASYLDGVMAIARAAAAVHPEMFEYSPSAEALDILNQAAIHKADILNAESEWQAAEGGVVYYVSPEGDDRNDGLSPETAWRSLGKINSARVTELGLSADEIDEKQFPQYQWAASHPDEWITLNPGDVVLFERGGLWRGGLFAAEGVTYSAYGSGAKPEFLGSPENGSGAEKWSLMEGTDNIWVYYQDMQECGGIMLDHETVAIKYAPFWDADTQRWLDFGQQEGLPAEEAQQCPEFDVRTMDDLQFFNALENITPEFPGWCWGRLYLRCDAGNPGEIYDSIEFFAGVDSWNRGISLGKDATLDNLSFRYHGGAVMMENGAVVRNCSVSYCGGIVMTYSKVRYETIDPGSWDVVRCGDGICAGKPGTTVSNNYISHMYDFGITVESGVFAWEERREELCRDITVSGNLLEYNGGGLCVVAWDALAVGYEAPFFTNINFIQNDVFYTGMGWSHANHYQQGISYLSSVIIGVTPGSSGEVHVIDNVFYDCWNIGQLVWYYYFNDDAAAAEFRNNTYCVSTFGARMVQLRPAVIQDGVVDAPEIFVCANNDLAENLAKTIGDTEATVILARLVFAAPEQITK